jgi:hypothetical protein
MQEGQRRGTDDNSAQPNPKKFGAAGLHMRSFAACPRCLPRVCRPASESSARLFKPSQAAATKETNWSRSFGSTAMECQLNFSPGSAPLPLSTELITGFPILKFWNRLTIWKQNTAIASKTTAYTTNDLVLNSSFVRTSLQ